MAGWQTGMLSWFSPYIFMGARQRCLLQQGTPIFTWHKVGMPTAGTIDPFLYVTPAQFDAQLALLREAGYESIPLGKWKPAQRERKVVLTFDDGFSSAREQAMELLARHKYHAIQFLVAGALG